MDVLPGRAAKAYAIGKKGLRMIDANRGNDNKPAGSEAGRTSSFGDSGKEPIGQIGPYRLLSVLGEGGFSIVYLAEQDRPVKRRVALKVIKPGMDTRQVIIRFEAERQALALLDHPNIAPVFDAGATEAGLPYFVMENVKGVPIIECSPEGYYSPGHKTVEPPGVHPG
ncbi:MAG: protein kinase [Planctomycetota bacterium]|jgi:serine/threonine protein kinase